MLGYVFEGAHLVEQVCFDLGGLGLERCDLVSHVAACAAGNVARLLETNVGVSADGEAVFLAMQAILQAPELGRGFPDLARRPHLQVETRDFAVGVFAGFSQRTD
ncbi:hypothetical protein D3C84_835720 [compost metagenome]